MIMGTFLLFSIGLASCRLVDDYAPTKPEPPKKRITFKESALISGYEYSIIEVDSVEYLTNSNGGICRITK
jgi:hypothetical protein